MTVKLIYPEKQPDDKSTIRIGPRVEHEIKRRVAELKARHPNAMTHADKRELHKLVTFLFLLRTSGEEQ
jgi:hypothetical protein